MVCRHMMTSDMLEWKVPCLWSKHSCLDTTQVWASLGYTLIQSSNSVQLRSFLAGSFKPWALLSCFSVLCLRKFMLMHRYINNNYDSGRNKIWARYRKTVAREVVSQVLTFSHDTLSNSSLQKDKDEKCPWILDTAL